ncbi:MAG: hypothetical protein ACREM2_02475 [Vulcanimicrobiaceae bacterium]
MTAAVAMVCFVTDSVTGKVTAVSSDGEATIYLLDDFSGTFDLAYRVRFEPAPSNRSWSTVSILLLPLCRPGSSLSVGLSRGYPNSATLLAFTTTSSPGARSTYRPFPVQCPATCDLELRGDSYVVAAIVAGRRIARWPRARFPMRNPYVQINGEVGSIGDRIVARLSPLKTTLRGKPVPLPSCAFTTQGIEPRVIGDRVLVIAGTRAAGGGAVDRCPSVARRE